MMSVVTEEATEAKEGQIRSNWEIMKEKNVGTTGSTQWKV